MNRQHPADLGAQGFFRPDELEEGLEKTTIGGEHGHP